MSQNQYLQLLHKWNAALGRSTLRYVSALTSVLLIDNISHNHGHFEQLELLVLSLLFLGARNSSKYNQNSWSHVLALLCLTLCTDCKEAYDVVLVACTNFEMICHQYS